MPSAHVVSFAVKYASRRHKRALADKLAEVMEEKTLAVEDEDQEEAISRDVTADDDVSIKPMMTSLTREHRDDIRQRAVVSDTSINETTDLDTMTSSFESSSSSSIQQHRNPFKVLFTTWWRFTDSRFRAEIFDSILIFFKICSQQHPKS